MSVSTPYQYLDALGARLKSVAVFDEDDSRHPEVRFPQSGRRRPLKLRQGVPMAKLMSSLVAIEGPRGQASLPVVRWVSRPLSPVV